MRVAIIGSGPAALAAAWQLVSRGVKPTIVDCGDVLPEASVQLAEKLKSAPAAGHAELISTLEGNPPTGSAVPKKLVFGSDFFHGHNRVHSPVINDSFIDPCFAKGGLTVGWGGAMLPIHPLDMQDWPIERSDLENGFEQVLSRLTCQAFDDGLSDDFPLYMPASEGTGESTQISDLVARLARIRKPSEFVSGRSRLAIDAANCRRCGLCLTGCPFDIIQTFNLLFDHLIRNDLIDYRSGHVVTSLRESADAVTLKCVDRNGDALDDLFCERVFLAAGAIGSTRIVLESLGRYDSDVKMLDSQKFAVPLLAPKGDPRDYHERLVLPEIFVDCRLPGIDKHWTHLQISPFSDYAARAMKKRLRILGVSLHGLLRPVMPKLMVGWGGLHSDYSGHFNLRLLRAHKRGRPILSIRAQENPDTRIRVKSAL